MTWDEAHRGVANLGRTLVLGGSYIDPINRVATAYRLGYIDVDEMERQIDQLLGLGSQEGSQ